MHGVPWCCTGIGATFMSKLSCVPLELSPVITICVARVWNSWFGEAGLVFRLSARRVKTIQQWVPHPPLLNLCCIVRDCIVPIHIALHCIVRDCIVLIHIALHCIVRNCIVPIQNCIVVPSWLSTVALFLVVHDCACSSIVVPLYHPAFTHLHLSISWHSQLCLLFTWAFSLNFPHYQIWPDIGKLQIQRDSLLIGRLKLVTKPAAFSFSVMQVIAQLNWLLRLSTYK